MASAFVLFGELKADTRAFERSLYDADVALNQTAQAINKAEDRAQSLGKTSATTARQFEKMRETLKQQTQTVESVAKAYQKGDITAKQFATSIASAQNRITSLNSRLKDSQARLTDWANRASKSGSMFQSVFGATLFAGGLVGAGLAMKNFTAESVKMFGTLDKLTRFTATLDKSFQTPEALSKFQEDIKKLSTEIPHSAESIAKASFQIKSAFQNLTEPELIEYLREFGNAATASNTDIASHAFNMAALAKQYKITATDLRAFSALMTSAFGQALATDEKVSAGFNRILSAAQSTKQPLNDMVAAMSTLQSVSSDAEGNTTLLLNTYAKLTDPKYIEGMKEMGVSVFDASGNFKTLNQLINEMAKELEGLNDQQVNEKLSWAKDLQAREGIKILIRQIADYNKQLRDGGDQEAFAKKNELMLNSVEAKWERFTNRIHNFKMSIGAAIVDITEGAQQVPPPKNWDGEMWYGVLVKGLRMAITGAYTDVQPVSKQHGLSLGDNLAMGMRVGIVGGQAGVISAAVDMANRAYQAAKDVLGIQSPSKKFKEIGEDVAQGFIEGITRMRASVHAAMADMVDVTKLKGLGKKDAGAVGLIRDLIQEYNELNPLTAKQAMLADIEAGKYGNVNKELREMALRLRERIDLLKEIKERNEKFLEWKSDLEGSGIASPDFSMFQAEGEGTGLFDVLEKEINAFETEWDVLIEKMGTPPPIDPWGTFWGGMQYHLEKFKNSLPSMKEALGVNLINSIEGIGNVFASAVQQWDGTAQGFFKNLASGFADMARQIIAELTRIMVMKAVMQIIGAFAGGIGGSAGGAGSSAGSSISGSISGLASGGMVRGSGSSTSDSILARLSNGEFVMSAKAVKKWGSGFMERLNSGFPSMTPAFAGGGMVGGATTNDYSTSWAPNITVIIPPGNPNPSAVRAASEQGIREGLKILDHQRRRSK